MPGANAMSAPIRALLKAMVGVIIAAKLYEAEHSPLLNPSTQAFLAGVKALLASASSLKD